MDAVSKRQLVLATFLLIQSWKLYEWLFEIIPPGYDQLDGMITFFFKWCAVEFIFLAAVKWAKVPKMIAGMGKWGLIWGGLMCLNIGLIVVGPLSGLSGRSAGLDTRAILEPLKNGLADDIAGSKEALIKGTVFLSLKRLYVIFRDW